MGNEKMSNLPGTPGWIAKNVGRKKHAAEENIEKEAGAIFDGMKKTKKKVRQFKVDSINKIKQADANFEKSHPYGSDALKIGAGAAALGGLAYGVHKVNRKYKEDPKFRKRVDDISGNMRYGANTYMALQELDSDRKDAKAEYQKALELGASAKHLQSLEEKASQAERAYKSFKSEAAKEVDTRRINSANARLIANSNYYGRR